jgi:hypothetical protein
LLRLGDAWTYEPYEAFDVRMPDGTTKSYGRISRSGVTWDNEFQVFTLASDVEELSTRSEDISMDYDFFHSDIIRVACGGNYTAAVIPRDINVWISRLFLGDSDGFCIVYYQDVDSMVYWAKRSRLPLGAPRYGDLVAGPRGHAALGTHAQTNMILLRATAPLPFGGGVLLLKTGGFDYENGMVCGSGGPCWVGWVFRVVPWRHGWLPLCLNCLCRTRLPDRVMCAIADKELSSNVGFKGIFPKSSSS